jgi:hypothetical protein
MTGIATTAAELALRRAIATNLRCGAAIWLRNGKTRDTYEWDVCNRQPGHDGDHMVWGDEDNAIWVRWTDEQPDPPKCRQVDLTSSFDHFEPSPWSDAEVAAFIAAS